MLPAPFTNALILTGPTGSGKTRLGITLAQKLDAEIISMDSMAVYRRMNIGTAKPTFEERQLVPHHLVDALEPWESASVAWWLEQASKICQDIEARGKQTLFVGGTPLYLKSLMFGLFAGPAADAAVRQRLVQEADQVGSEELHQRLAQVDPFASQRIHPNDLRRIVRALEVWELTGKPISAWQTQWGKEKRPNDLSFSPCLWLDLPRPELYSRINQRVDAMFAAGLVEEVRSLRQLEKPLGLEATQALGYKEVFAYLNGCAGLEDTIDQVKIRSRQFAKRQISWFRHLPGCRPVTSELTEMLWQPKMRM
jgi:tRNA dimethylallyltransferase